MSLSSVQWSICSNPRTKQSIEESEHSKLLKPRRHDGTNDQLTEQQINTFRETRPLHEFIESKVDLYLQENPLNLMFIKREKGRLPYSVFKPHAQESTFLESIFEGRQATAFFQYPAYVKIERKCDRIRKYKREEVETLFMAFKIADNTHIYNAVVNSCKCAGWNMLENSDLFNLQWTGYVMPIDIKDLNRY
jgi:hypothetical protein